jgi:histone deacetylase complex regulatory component SIN3
MTIKVFEKDSATFDSFPNFDATKRWQHYVNAYASLEVTEGVNMTEAQWPVHARSVPTDRALDGDNEAATVPERSEEGLVFRITQQRKIHFAPHNIEWLLNYPSSRDLKTQKDKYEQRTQVGAEKYVTNNQWMQGRSRDFVDNIKAMAAAILQGEAAQEVQVTQEHGVAQDDSATQAQGTVPATDTAEEGGGADQQVDSNMSGTEN